MSTPAMRTWFAATTTPLKIIDEIEKSFIW